MTNLMAELDGQELEGQEPEDAGTGGDDAL